MKKNKENNRTQRIEELRNSFHSIGNPSEDFKKSIQKQCENEGIDWELIQLSYENYQTILKKGNINEF